MADRKPTYKAGVYCITSWGAVLDFANRADREDALEKFKDHAYETASSTRISGSKGGEIFSLDLRDPDPTAEKLLDDMQRIPSEQVKSETLRLARERAAQEL